MTSFMKMILIVEEEKVGSIISLLAGKVQQMSFESVEVVDGRSARKQQTRKKENMSDRIIAFFKSNPFPLSTNELARALDVHYPSLSTMLGKMKKDGLVIHNKQTKTWSLPTNDETNNHS